MFVAQSIESNSRIPTDQSNRFRKTASFFDWLDYLSERAESLVGKVKPLVFGLAFLLFLTYEMADIGKYKLSKWNQEALSTTTAPSVTNENNSRAKPTRKHKRKKKP